MPALAPASARVTVNGQYLSARVKALILDAAKAAGIPESKVYVTQGSYKGEGAAAASGSTHDLAGAFDLRTWNLTTQEALRFVYQLRRRNVAAWFRAPAFGWTQTGPHIHGIVKDEPGLSRGAAWQVSEYDAGRNGLSNAGRDPHPRPQQETYLLRRRTRVIVPITGVYAEPSWRSRKVASRVFGNPVDFVGIVRDVEGRRWLKTPNGNFVLAARTAIGR